MILKGFLDRRSALFVVWTLAVLILFEPVPIVFSQTQDAFTKLLREAEKSLYDGLFQEAIDILEKKCLNQAEFPRAKKKEAYELLYKSYMALSYVEEARTAIRKLLELAPNYVAPPNRPDLAAEVEKVRQEMGESAKTTEETAWYESTWFLVAGGVVVAGVAGLLIFSGNGNGPPPPPPNEVLPVPPTLP